MVRKILRSGKVPIWWNGGFLMREPDGNHHVKMDDLVAELEWWMRKHGFEVPE